MTKHHRERNLIGQEYRNDHHVACSPYFGELEAETAEIEWGGAVCHNGPFDI
ncbi:hypothetical protein QFZ55_002414 [Streptomyces luteogriseus]|uniref:hypothetical protein n=1 Tax=Streptomyces luteogriseus TaxID=68233 RepID=UPI00278039F5|nr:hypothetical protein [Streptomyces luteogriseus]MDQ0712962.1 hypothetical protein [Streptomyces luteogriseus]